MNSEAFDKVEHSEIVPIFPTLLWKTRLKPGFYQPNNQAIISMLEQRSAKLPALSFGQMRQTEQTLHLHEVMKPLIEVFEGAIGGVLEFLKVSYREFAITGCWANIAAPGKGHMAHTHPNNFLSGVYYLRVGEGANRIVFDDPRPQTNIISPVFESTEDLNAGQVFITAKEGLLILFPSWLQHSVPTNKSDQPRISISFNMQFKQYDEKVSVPKWDGNILLS